MGKIEHMHCLPPIENSIAPFVKQFFLRIWLGECSAIFSC